MLLTGSFSPHLALNPLQYLSPSSCSPGLSFFLSAGIAGRSWRGVGAGVDSCSFRFSFWSYVAYGADAGREVADLIGRIWHWLVFLLCFIVLRWSESEMWRRRETKISVNKAVSGGFGGQRCSDKPLLLPRRGDERKEELLLAVSGWPSHLQQGNSSASSRRFTTAPLSPYSTAEGRPLQPRAAATNHGRPQDFNNLQAFLPVRRPFGLAVVGSHLHTPSGFVPGGVEVDSGEPCSGGAGAGLDHVFCLYSEVLSAKCKGQFVNLAFFRALSENCISTADNE